MQKKYILLFIISSVFFSSCASVLGGKMNTISTEEVYPANAKIYLNNREIGQGVFKIKVSKYDLQEGDLLLVKSDGYINDTIIIERKVNNWYATADFVSTMGIGLIFDVGTGNLYRPNTQNLRINLKKKEDKK